MEWWLGIATYIRITFGWYEENKWLLNVYGATVLPQMWKNVNRASLKWGYPNFAYEQICLYLFWKTHSDCRASLHQLVIVFAVSKLMYHISVIKRTAPGCLSPKAVMAFTAMRRKSGQILHTLSCLNIWEDPMFAGHDCLFWTAKDPLLSPGRKPSLRPC